MRIKCVYVVINEVIADFGVGRNIIGNKSANQHHNVLVCGVA